MVAPSSGWWVWLGAGAVNLEILYVQDVTASFARDWRVIADQVPRTLEAIEADYPDTRFGLATFADKPVKPFGGHVVAEDLKVEDYCFRLRYPLSFNISNFEGSFAKVSVRNGGDSPDCQLTALAEATSQAVRWSPGSEYARSHSEIRKIAILVTDSPFHKAGDLLKVYPEEAQDYELEEESNQSGSEVIDYVNDMVDYPSVDQVNDLLADANITPVFIVKKDAMQYYASAFSDGYVFGLDDDSANIGELIQTALNTVLTTDKFGCIGADCPDPADEEDAKDDQFVNFDEIPATLKVEIDGTGLDDEFNLDDFKLTPVKKVSKEQMRLADVDDEPIAADDEPIAAADERMRIIGQEINNILEDAELGEGGAEIIREANAIQQTVDADIAEAGLKKGKDIVVKETYEDPAVVPAKDGDKRSRVYVEEGSDLKQYHRKNATNFDLADLHVDFSR